MSIIHVMLSHTYTYSYIGDRGGEPYAITLLLSVGIAIGDLVHSHFSGGHGTAQCIAD